MSTVQPEVEVKIERKSLSLWQDAWRRLRQNTTAMISLVAIIMFILVAVFAPWLAPYEYWDQDYAYVMSPPNEVHLLGTDELGRDILSRIIWGTRVSISVGIVVASVTVFLGMVMGLISGYYGGIVDMIIMRIVDILYAFPGLLFAILIMAILGASITNVFLALSITGWAGMARLVRGQVLSLKETEFVEAAKALGAKDFRILFVHLMPNILSPVIVTVTMGMGGWILSEAALSFLGIGVAPPFPSWGMMISAATPYFTGKPHMVFFPSAALAIVILAFNFLGDGLRDALDPKLKT